MNRKIKILLSDEQGIALIISIVMLLVITGVGTYAINSSKVEGWLSSNYKSSKEAFYVAEAGLELMKAYLKNDASSDSSHSWANSPFKFPSEDTPVTNSSSYYSITLPDSVRTISLGSNSGTFAIRLKNVGSPSFSFDKIIVESTGTISGATAITEAYLIMKDLGAWNNAVFAGAGSGQAINGNVNISGSVHILGTGLTSTQSAVSMSGSSLVGNNYDSMSDTLKALLPSIGSPEDLEAELRVRRGKVGLSGSAQVGQTESATAQKDTVKGVYVTDGYGGTVGASGIHSDNGTGNAYDLGNDLSFPSLNDAYTDPDTGTSYATYSAYLTAKSYEYTGNLDISANTASFSIGNANGSITWNQSTNSLTISGSVKIVGRLDIATNNESVTYTGKGTLYSTQSIYIHDDLLPPSGFPGFPATNALGLIAAQNIEIATGGGEAQLQAAGAFYAENSIISSKQNEIAGTFVSNYFNLENTPSIYQVPELSRNLPPFMPGSGGNYYVQVGSWRTK